jgi:hypothetical protein
MTLRQACEIQSKTKTKDLCAFSGRRDPFHYSRSFIGIGIFNSRGIELLK